MLKHHYFKSASQQLKWQKSNRFDTLESRLKNDRRLDIAHDP